MKRIYLALILTAAFMILLALVMPVVALAWDVVIKDKWDELFRIDKIHEDRFAIYYDGEWEWRAPINGQTTGKASAVLLKAECSPQGGGECREGLSEAKANIYHTSSLVITGWYGDGDTMYLVLYPYTAWYDISLVYRWYGVKYWVRDTQYWENIYCDVIEGRIWIYHKIFYPSGDQ